MVNPMLTPLFNPNVKDSRWLTLEVCREFQRSKCSRTENECKFAHPPPHVEVQNGRVTCCFDSIKGKCQRKEPPCKYLHPPQHLREQLLQNGKNNLILRNLQMQYIAAGLQPMIPAGGAYPVNEQQPQVQNSTGVSPNSQTPAYYAYEQVPPYLVPQNSFGGYQLGGTMLPAMDAAAASGSIATTTVPGVLGSAGTKMSRPDRLEVCREFERATCTRQPTECRFAHPPENVAIDQTDNSVTVCMDFIKGKCSRESCRYFHPPPHLQAQIKLAQQRANATAAAATAQAATTSPQLQGMAGMVPMVKRPATIDSKSGIPMYQPNAPSATAYQQALAAMQLQQQQPFVPVSTTLQQRQSAGYASYPAYFENVAGHPPSVPRF